jgi:hypothetical protein
MERNKSILGILLLVLVILLTNCSKDEIGINQKEILGTWIAVDKSDTLEFTSESDFNKSNGYMISDHYDYELFKDSIEIGYRGKMYVLVYPTMHQYSIDNGNLIIDFSNKQCYGFPLQEMTYIKEK